MNNDTPLPMSELQPENPPAAPFQPEPEPPPVFPDAVPIQPGGPQKSNKKLWTILGIAFGLFACCCVVIGGFAASAIVKSANERAPIEAVLDSYMKSMAAKNAESAYALFSPRAKRQFPLSKIQENLEGNNYILFEGYQSVSLSTVNINAAFATNPDKPQGTVAVISGAISYKDGIQGTIKGTLEKVNDVWQIYGVAVTVPPGKFK